MRARLRRAPRAGRQAGCRGRGQSAQSTQAASTRDGDSPGANHGPQERSNLQGRHRPAQCRPRPARGMGPHRTSS
eukprot:scaffold8791_cov98-Isochrysis_galbana.AAC.3